MRTSILKLSFMLSAFAMFSLTACKSGPKDADIEKAVNEKIAAASADIADAGATVKDGVVTLTGQFKDEASRSTFETSVKAVPGVKSVVNNTTVAAAPAPAPVVVASDEQLKQGVRDATKDFPGVTAEVKDSVIILTGEIKRASLKNLMQSLNTLKPKKIQNNLTIK
ncbi:MAG TPA: BON domain-containing protein [Chitinophagaceae bacterium]|nr:BON domain-containing protein [Chitinophagaceae bacterium]